jgi:glycosyltransferase involved in cell wall biosynthesis
MTVVALLGRKDEPADGVEDYCTFLGSALARRGVELRQVRVNWHKTGWFSALRDLRRECVTWRGKWVLIQYTALGWSRRGFPFAALIALAILRRGGARAGIVFHEPYRQGDSWPRWIDRVRGACQDWVIHRLYAGSEKCVFADPIEKISWLPSGDRKAAFIPIGANIPEPVSRSKEKNDEQNGGAKTVAVFCLTQPPRRKREVGDISYAVRSASANGMKLRVVFVGRGTPEAKTEIERAFEGIAADVSVLGLVSAGEISETLAGCDAMLCVRGEINSRRGSVIAGIACGLPIIGYAGSASGTPIAEAGIDLVPDGDPEALGAALTRVLSDSDLRNKLREKSLCAQSKYFSWDTIANTFIQSLALLTNGT